MDAISTPSHVLNSSNPVFPCPNFDVIERQDVPNHFLPVNWNEMIIKYEAGTSQISFITIKILNEIQMSFFISDQDYAAAGDYLVTDQNVRAPITQEEYENTMPLLMETLNKFGLSPRNRELITEANQKFLNKCKGSFVFYGKDNHPSIIATRSKERGGVYFLNLQEKSLTFTPFYVYYKPYLKDVTLPLNWKFNQLPLTQNELETQLKHLRAWQQNYESELQNNYKGDYSFLIDSYPQVIATLLQKSQSRQFDLGVMQYTPLPPLSSSRDFQAPELQFTHICVADESARYLMSIQRFGSLFYIDKPEQPFKQMTEKELNQALSLIFHDSKFLSLNILPSQLIDLFYVFQSEQNKPIKKHLG